MSARVVIQARLSSSRLPAKALLSLSGVPLVVLAAFRAANTGLDVVVATSDHPDDDILAKTLERHKIKVVRGSLEDPLSRFVLATQDLEPDDTVVRFTADNTFPDGGIADLLLQHVTPENAYVRIGGGNAPTVPYGLSGEAFLVSALRAAHASTTERHDREHVTPWIRERFGDLPIMVDAVRNDWSVLRCTIDTYDDYVQVAKVFDVLEDPVAATWDQLLEELASQRSGIGPRLPIRQHPGRVVQSNVILGTAQLGMPYGAANARGALDDNEALDVLYSAATSGITHVDTARAYGESERRIGLGSRRGLSEHLRVITKLAPLDTLNENSSPEHGAAAVKASVFESMNALGTSKLETLLLHRTADWSRPGVKDALLDLQRSERIGVLGASVVDPEQLFAVLDDEALAYVQLPFNLLDWRWRIPEVKEALDARPDVTVVARSVFLQGLLVGDASTKWPRNFDLSRDELSAALGKSASMCERKSVADLALAYVLGQDWITSAVIGAETPTQISEFADLALRSPLTEEQIDIVDAIMPRVSLVSLDPSQWE